MDSTVIYQEHADRIVALTTLSDIATENFFTLERMRHRCLSLQCIITGSTLHAKKSLNSGLYGQHTPTPTPTLLSTVQLHDYKRSRIRQHRAFDAKWALTSNKQRGLKYWEAARQSFEYTRKVTRGRINFGYEIHRIQASPLTMMDVVQTQARPPMQQSSGGWSQLAVFGMESKQRHPPALRCHP
jgi:hypothetical protein